MKNKLDLWEFIASIIIFTLIFGLAYLFLLITY